MTQVELVVTTPQPPPLGLVLSRDVPAGTLLRLAADGSTTLNSLDIAGVEYAGSPLPVIHRFSRDEQAADWDWHISTMEMICIRTGRDLPAGAMLSVASAWPAGSGGGGPIQAGGAYAGLAWMLTLGAVEHPRAVAMQPVADPLVVVLLPGPAATIEACLKPDGRCTHQHYDARGNPAAADCEVSVRQSPQPSSRLEAVDAKGRCAVANAAPRGLDGTPIWFGDLHWHCDFSGDGQRSLDAALASARDELHLDFAAPSDHIGPDGRYSRGTVAQQAAICRSHDRPGQFQTLAGLEVSARYGHANVYTDDFALLEQLAAGFAAGDFGRRLHESWARGTSYPLAELSALIPPGRGIIVPHHTNMDSFIAERVKRPDGLPYWCAMHWPPPAHGSPLRLVEMVQSRGAFESEQPDATWRTAFGGLGGSVQTALVRGHRLGFVGGTDNHCGWPTRCGDQRCGMTAILGAELDGPSLYSALAARRCYATSGARIVADATLNGRPAGSELALAPGQERVFRIEAHGTAPLTHVQIVHNCVVLADLPVPRGAWDFAAQWADQRPGRPLHDAWYYIRIRQADGHCAWLSPFWIDLSDR